MEKTLKIVLTAGMNYLLCVGLIKLICLCFALTFTWKCATGIWLVIWLARWAARPYKTS